LDVTQTSTRSLSEPLSTNAARVTLVAMRKRDAVLDTTTASATDAHSPVRAARRERPPGLPVRVCARCERVDHGGSWVQAELVIRALQTYRQPDPPALVYAICPDCFERVEALRRRVRVASVRGTSSAGLSPERGHAA
jgi:hypothetical protein